MRKIWYMGLEKYQGRYTLQLESWNEIVFKKREIEYEIVEGKTLDNSQAIQTGQVLDAHGRMYFSMSQMMNLVKYMQEGRISSNDIIFFEDMFTGGIESLPYIMDQIPRSSCPKIYVRCLAQTIDPDDFVHVWNMYDWMSKYEKMVDSFVDGILCASEEMVANLHIAGWKADKFVTGLPFGKAEVQSRVPILPHFLDRPKRVVFAARWDQEKQPGFFMDLVEEYKKLDPDVEFAILCGSKLKSNNYNYMDRMQKLVDQNLLTKYENLDKNSYYELLANSRVLFNCALQDWVSNTVSEADALGTNVLYPAYRSFPETFANDKDRLYIPWSLEDASNKLDNLLIKPHSNIGKISDYQDKTIDRTIDIFQGQTKKYWRGAIDYRKHTLPAKF